MYIFQNLYLVKYITSNKGLWSLVLKNFEIGFKTAFNEHVFWFYLKYCYRKLKQFFYFMTFVDEQYLF